MSANIRKEIGSGKPRSQSIAIALSQARKTGGSYGKEKFGKITSGRMKALKARMEKRGE